MKSRDLRTFGTFQVKSVRRSLDSRCSLGMTVLGVKPINCNFPLSISIFLWYDVENVRGDMMQVTIEALEAYLHHHYGGRGNEQGLFMKLVEEMGEIAEVLNQRAGRKACDSRDLDAELGNELADLIHYAVAIAAINGLDLNRIILDKDRRASVKYHHDVNLEQFLTELPE